MAGYGTDSTAECGHPTTSLLHFGCEECDALTDQHVGRDV